MIKIAHESMNAIFNHVSALTDYDYFLVHLLDKDPAYQKIALESSRMKILDNSIFELGTAYDAEKYLDWIERLRPTIAVIPDVLDDYKGTIESKEEWFRRRPPWAVEYMGVVQGATDEEMIKCYENLSQDSRIAIIGISFNSLPFQNVPEGSIERAYMRGRITFLNHLTNTGTVLLPKPLHLLGVALPQEMRYYRDFYRRGIIRSVDTSSPVVHGYHGVRYSPEGLPSKHKVKLHDLIGNEVSQKRLIDITYNICMFRALTRRRLY